jgi:hypothetical protein
MHRTALLLSLLGCGRDHFDPPHNIAFVTQALHAPLSFGSDLSGADAICAAAASDGGLPGTYVAYLWTQATPAVDRLSSWRGWVRVDGKPFVDRPEYIEGGGILYPLRIDELGEDIGAAPIAIGTTAPSAGDCGDWTTPGINFTCSYSHASVWGYDASCLQSCSAQFHVACFETTFTAPLEITPVAGRRAFVTVQDFVAGGGLPAADTQCMTEANLAGLSGEYRALLATTTATAISRFDLSGPPWVRVDGVRVAAPLALAAGDLEAPPSLTALGTGRDVEVMGGGLPGQVALSDCSDWTATTGNAARVGMSDRAGPDAFDNGSIDSTCAGPIYCLEK